MEKEENLKIEKKIYIYKPLCYIPENNAIL